MNDNKTQKTHLPFFGVGPYYVFGAFALTALCIWLSVSGLVNSLKAEQYQTAAYIIGGVLAAFGLSLWIAAIVGSKIMSKIAHNQLVTSGVYSLTRNPIYSAAWFICTGACVAANDLWLIAVPFVLWLALTILMKRTEEKWLLDLYGEQYVEYCRHVNRCIPFFHLRK